MTDAAEVPGRAQFDKMGGLIPAIVQDATDGRVLMLGFMNKDALRRTLDERQVVFWSRSKSRLWKKGETSGNILHLVSIGLDCDQDALLIQARPSGPVCHTGSETCFVPSERPSGGTLRALESVIHERKKLLPEGSYTATLFREGIARIAQKVGEEAVELSIASQYPGKGRCVEEAADLLYHLMVLLAERDIALTEVLRELDNRTGR
jgi:phosphoribosyl-ATP pyrophosphohydrolase/phosphoribosyl-AMP cyclohydrolase